MGERDLEINVKVRMPKDNYEILKKILGGKEWDDFILNELPKSYNLREVLVEYEREVGRLRSRDRSQSETIRSLEIRIKDLQNECKSMIGEREQAKTLLLLLVRIIDGSLHNIGHEYGAIYDFVMQVREACKNVAQLDTESFQERITKAKEAISLVSAITRQSLTSKKVEELKIRYGDLVERMTKSNDERDVKIFEPLLISVRDILQKPPDGLSPWIYLSELLAAEKVIDFSYQALSSRSVISRLNRLREVGFHEPLTV